MTPVRATDVGAVAWTLAWAFTDTFRPAPVRRTLAAVSYLVWVGAVVVMPGFVHAGRMVVVRVSRRSALSTLVLLVRMAAVLLLVFVLLAALLTVMLLGWVHPAVVLALLVVLVVWLAGSALVVLAALIPRIVVIARESRRARRAHPPEQAQADRSTFRQAQWTIDTAASRLPIGGLATINQHLRQVIPPGQVVATQAATLDHVRIYQRYGFAPLATAPLTLIALASSPDWATRTIQRGVSGHCEG